VAAAADGRISMDKGRHRGVTTVSRGRTAPQAAAQEDQPSARNALAEPTEAIAPGLGQPLGVAHGDVLLVVA